jgi:hypothetical protein
LTFGELIDLNAEEVQAFKHYDEYAGVVDEYVLGIALESVHVAGAHEPRY